MKTLQIQKWRTLKNSKRLFCGQDFSRWQRGFTTEGRKPKFSDVARHQKQNKATYNISANNLWSDQNYSQNLAHKQKTTVRQPCVTEKKKKNTETKLNSQNRTFFSARKRASLFVVGDKRTNTQIHTHTKSGNTSDGTSEKLKQRVKTETTRHVWSFYRLLRDVRENTLICSEIGRFKRRWKTEYKAERESKFGEKVTKINC